MIDDKMFVHFQNDFINSHQIGSYKILNYKLSTSRIFIAINYKIKLFELVEKKYIQNRFIIYFIVILQQTCKTSLVVACKSLN